MEIKADSVFLDWVSYDTLIKNAFCERSPQDRYNVCVDSCSTFTSNNYQCLEKRLILYGK